MAGMRGEITAKMLILVVSLVAAVLVIILVFMITTNNLPPFLEAMERFFCKIPFLCGGKQDSGFGGGGAGGEFDGGLESLVYMLAFSSALYIFKIHKLRPLTE